MLKIAPDGKADEVATVENQPSEIGLLPDGRVLVVSMEDRRILRRHHDGTLTTHADLIAVTSGFTNDPSSCFNTSTASLFSGTPIGFLALAWSGWIHACVGSACQVGKIALDVRGGSVDPYVTPGEACRYRSSGKAYRGRG